MLSPEPKTGASPDRVRSAASLQRDRPSRGATVVGGSLAGLCAALALSTAGWQVTILERRIQAPEGMGISVDRAFLSSVVGADMRGLPVIETGLPATGWGLLRQALADQVRSRTNIHLREGVSVNAIIDGAIDVTLETTAGEHRTDLVVGADGYASTVRKAIVPENSHAEYGGVVLWRGLLEEQEIPGGFTDRDTQFSFRSTGSGMLATYVIPGTRGETSPGRRRGVFITFDRSRDSLVRDGGYVEGKLVKGTVQGPHLSDEQVRSLHQDTVQWPPPWGPAIATAITRRNFIGTPIAEYLPTQLVHGRTVIIGDAAHSVSPVTGAGFQNGLLDVQALTAALNETTGIAAALQHYEAKRLDPARGLVARSRAWSRSYVAST